MIAIAWVAYSRVLAAGVALAIVGLLLQATQDNFAISLVVGLRLGWVAALDLMRQLLTTLSIALLVLLGSRLLPFLGMSIPVGIVVLAVAILLVHERAYADPHLQLATLAQVYVGHPAVLGSSCCFSPLFQSIDSARLSAIERDSARVLQRILSCDRGAHCPTRTDRRLRLSDFRTSCRVMTMSVSATDSNGSSKCPS